MASLTSSGRGSRSEIQNIGLKTAQVHLFPPLFKKQITFQWELSTTNTILCCCSKLSPSQVGSVVKQRDLLELWGFEDLDVAQISPRIVIEHTEMQPKQLRKGFSSSRLFEKSGFSEVSFVEALNVPRDWWYLIKHLVLLGSVPPTPQWDLTWEKTPLNANFTLFPPRYSCRILSSCNTQKCIAPFKAHNGPQESELPKSQPSAPQFQHPTCGIVHYTSTRCWWARKSHNFGGRAKKSGIENASWWELHRDLSPRALRRAQGGFLGNPVPDFLWKSQGGHHGNVNLFSRCTCSSWIPKETVPCFQQYSPHLLLWEVLDSALGKTTFVLFLMPKCPEIVQTRHPTE